MTKNSSNSSSRKSGNTRQISPCKHWCFTWNNYPKDHNDLISSNSSILRYVYQEELGETRNVIHLQGYIEFTKKVRPLGMFPKEIHWEKCRDIKGSIKYCSKEKTRNGEIFIKNIVLEKPLKLIDNLRDWQKDIINIIKEEPDDRTIRWYYDYKGNIGKTALCKYICVNFNAIYISGKSSDCKYMIVKYKESKGGFPDVVIFDIPRCNMDYINYEAIEKIKDGIFFSNKYECDMVIMNSPHLLIFANEEPDYNKLSSDRWTVSCLSGWGLPSGITASRGSPRHGPKGPKDIGLNDSMLLM